MVKDVVTVLNGYWQKCVVSITYPRAATIPYHIHNTTAYPIVPRILYPELVRLGRVPIRKMPRRLDSAPFVQYSRHTRSCPPLAFALFIASLCHSAILPPYGRKALANGR